MKEKMTLRELLLDAILMIETIEGAKSHAFRTSAALSLAGLGSAMYDALEAEKFEKENP